MNPNRQRFANVAINYFNGKEYLIQLENFQRDFQNIETISLQNRWEPSFGTKTTSS